MPDNEILISTRYESVGDVELQRTYDRLLNKVNQTGYAFQNIGRLLGNQFLQDVGRAIGAVDDLAHTIDNVSAAIKKMPKLGSAFAAASGVLLGSSFYDDTIGKIQGTNTETILSQIKELIRVGFNTDTLKVEARVAMVEGMVSENSKFRYEPSQVSQDLAKQLRSLGLGGSLSLPDLQKAQTETEKLLQLRITEGDVVGSTVAQVSNSLDLIKRAIAELEAVNKSAATQTFAKNAAFGQNIRSSFEIGDRVAGLGASLKGNQAALGMALASIERDAQQQRLNVARSYTQDLAAIDEAYYKQRNELAAQFGVEAARAEEDHQREMRRANEDHNKRLTRLAESRDALGIADEISNYKQERNRAEEDYQIQAARRSEDFARQLKQLEQSNIEQRNARTRAFNQQIQDINEQAEIRRQYERQQTALLIQAILDEYRKAIAQLQTVSPISNAPNWNGPNNTLNTTLNFGSVSNPNQIATIVHQEMTRVMREAVRR